MVVVSMRESPISERYRYFASEALAARPLALRRKYLQYVRYNCVSVL